MNRQLCATPVCSDIARRTVLREKYCEPCAASVEQAAYMQSLPAKSAEQVRYRHTFADVPPDGVTIPPPLGMPARPGWRSRR